MKLLKDKGFSVIDSIAASSTASGFPVTNLKLYDPGIIWRAAAFNTAVNIVCDLGAVGAVGNIWLNNANFFNATIQANSSNDWTSPAVSKNIVLKTDKSGIIKGFFDLSTTNYRYVRVTIPVQSLTVGSVPQLGNIIIGTASEFKISSWQTNKVCKWMKFEADSGSLKKARKGRARQTFTIGIQTTEPNIESMNFEDCELMLLYTELSSVADSYMVYAPEAENIGKRNNADAEISFTVEERV